MKKQTYAARLRAFGLVSLDARPVDDRARLVFSGKTFPQITEGDPDEVGDDVESGDDQSDT